jgi:redox-sensitive bicupin YhaK (pirin superfamily)
MLNVIKSEERYHANHGWLDTRWHFSFGDYYDAENMNWGPLRVFNDDIVQPASGFPMHPHRDMEIITYVIDGQLDHKDSLGNHGAIHPGEVQVMSAGKGITHSEYNASKTTPVRLLQLWVMPRTKSSAARWEQRVFDPAHASGKLLPVVSSGDLPETLTIDQDARIYVARLNKDQKVTHEAAKGRHAYLFVIEGALTLNGTTLNAGDQARIVDEPRLDLVATKDAHVILLDMA